MSILMNLFEKADVKQMSIGMEPEGMMQTIMKLLDSLDEFKENIDQHGDEWKSLFLRDLKKTVNDSYQAYTKHVARLREITKDKEDRVVWGVRWLKVAHLIRCIQYCHEMLGFNETAMIEKISRIGFIKKLEAKMRSNAFSDFQSTFHSLWGEPTGRSSRMLSQLDHFLSQNIPPIEEYVFQYQSIDSLLSDFSNIERIYQQRFGQYISFDKSMERGDKVIKWYDNKTKAWVRLSRAHCSDEANAMGHCGNSPRSHTGDNILSFRSVITDGGKKYWKPHLTFILTEDGNLTEMKGRGNKKPHEKYHPYIVDLIKMDFVEAVVGGGYLPHENFSLSDLEEEDREALEKEKPELEHPLSRWQNAGKDDPNIKEICAALQDRIYDITGEGVEVDTFHIRGDTGYTISDMADYLKTDDDHFIKTAMKQFGIEKDQASIMYHLAYNIMTNDDYDECMEMLIEDNPKIEYNMITALIRYAIRSGDGLLKKQLVKYFKASTQGEFPFISNEQKMATNLDTVVNELLNSGKNIHQTTYDTLFARYGLNVFHALIHTRYYGHDKTAYINDDPNELPIGRIDIKYETSDDAFGQMDIDDPDEELKYIFGESYYAWDSSGEEPPFFTAGEKWQDGYADETGEIIAGIITGEYFLIDDLVNENTLHDIYYGLTNKRHPDDKRPDQFADAANRTT